MARAKETTAERRARRVRYKLKSINRAGTARLTVFRSNNHIAAQVIDDSKGHTVAAASTLDKDIKAAIKNGSNADAATKVGQLIAERAKKAGVKKVMFDRGSYIYHGRVKALAEAARSAGLEF
jgi:large subunit ribosomal protein L18